jgi:Uma2 family endonuclease
MSTATQRLTYEEWLNLPETKQRYEIVDGVVCMAPGATVFHQRIMRRVERRLSDFVEINGLGEVFTPPLDILIQREPLRTRQPDILFLSARRMVIGGPEEAIATKFLDVPPDIVVEILSPSDTPSVLNRKLRDYQDIGVPECWIFSQMGRTAEVLDLTGNEPQSIATFGVEDTLRSDLLPGFELNLSEVFK